MHRYAYFNEGGGNISGDYLAPWRRAGSLIPIPMRMS